MIYLPYQLWPFLQPNEENSTEEWTLNSAMTHKHLVGTSEVRFTQHGYASILYETVYNPGITCTSIIIVKFLFKGKDVHGLTASGNTAHLWWYCEISTFYMYLAEYDKNSVMQKSLGNPKTVELYF